MPSCGGPGRSASARHGRASKGGSPCNRLFASTPVPRIAWLLVVLGLLLAIAAGALWSGSRQRLPNAVRPGTQRRDRHESRRRHLCPRSADPCRTPHRRRHDLRFRPDLLARRDEAHVPAWSGVRLTTKVSSSRRQRRWERSPRLDPPALGLDWVDWSPDSRQIVFLSRKTPKARAIINVVNVDGSGLTTLDVGRSAHFVSWLPPLGRRDRVPRRTEHAAARPGSGRSIRTGPGLAS